MTNINLAQAKAELSALVDRAVAGETVCITKRGKPMVQLVAIPAPRMPIDFEALRAVREGAPYQEESAGDFMRRVRDDYRY